MKTGAELISDERARQPGLGFDAEHDSQHDDGVLAVIAAIMATDGTDAHLVDPLDRVIWEGGICDDPWELTSKHRKDRVRQLAIAGALIAAEIDRIQGRSPNTVLGETRRDLPK